MSPAPHRRRPLAGFMAADAISLTGTRLSMIAVPWLVLTTTGSASKTGLVAFAETLTLVLSKAASGPLIDRIGARRISVSCDALSFLVIGAVPVLYAVGLLHLAVLIGLVALGGFLRGPGDAAKSALVPSLADHAGVPLERVTGLSGTIERSATFLGAASAGALVTWLGPARAVGVDAASFAFCAVVFWVATRALSAPKRSEPREDTSYLTELREGWQFLRRDAVLVGLCVMVASTNLLDQAFSTVLLPVWARNTGYGVAAIGTYFAVWSVASAGGAGLAAWQAARLPRFRVYVIAFLITGLPRFALFALGAPLWLLLAAAVVGGLASGFLNPILGAVIYERIPAPMLGRVSSLNTALCWSLMPLGGLLGGLLVTTNGLAVALWVAGAAYFAATMLPLVRPSFREFDRRPGVPDEQPAGVTVA